MQEPINQLIDHELSEQVRWQRLHNLWDSRRERQRLRLRHRYLTIVSNIASVAALLIVGLIMQNVAAGVKASRLQSNVAPSVLQATEQTDSLQAEP